MSELDKDEFEVAAERALDDEDSYLQYLKDQQDEVDFDFEALEDPEERLLPITDDDLDFFDVTDTSLAELIRDFCDD